ncbi:hypothetical protein P2G88_02100 [Aliiglaciecola sp. CAU 1673]|uniref:PEP-CTERM sorting domain-containing protein n=1 Tax=Aliiglaciecola sp. CAU 1673 TaxID=3032595 RepID=UPI0023DA7556|nr:PEP-CTERM sorting domain-containing protein [Aliiglaciecola sp. CAU 1673]MDF2177043.1 hypothetical protein [Aliiglaciecola sp. CAU 1673]
MKTTKQNITSLLVGACVASALYGTAAQASHFRGAAVVPQVDANGTLTVDAKSFWRQAAGTPAGTFPHSGISTLSISGPGLATSISFDSISQDLSDSRRAEINQVFTQQLPGAGLYTMSWSSSSWVSGVPNAGGGYGTTSTIFWDGSTANAPIIFDLESVQQEVVRGSAYSDNLDALGVGLTYDDTFLATGMGSQATGYSIDASGQISISGASTATYSDNVFNPGADQAFSGKISATDGSNVEFVWLFDAVDVGSNQAPSITDVVINALVGDTINHTLVVSDPNGDPVTVSFDNFVGVGGVMPGNALFNTGTLDFSWDSSGFGVGQYKATFTASDGSLTDQGSITINLSRAPNGQVPAPASLFLAATGLLALAGVRRKKKAK